MSFLKKSRLFSEQKADSNHKNNKETKIRKQATPHTTKQQQQKIPS